MSNILTEITGLVGSNVLSSLTSHLGESNSAVTSGISGMASTILAGMLNKSSDQSAFGGIFDMLNKPDNANVLDNLGSLVGGGNLAQGDPKDLAGDLMGKLFGNKVGGILDLVASASGLKKGSSSSLLGLVGPMVMSYLAKRIFKGGLNAGSLISLLTGQKDNIVRGLPTGMGSMLGLADMRNDSPTPTNYVDNNESTSKLMPVIIGLAALAAAFFGLRNCNTTDVIDTGNETISGVTGELSQSIDNAMEDTTDTISNAAENVTGAMSTAVDGVGGMGSAMVDSAGDMGSAAVEGVGSVVTSATELAGDATSAAGTVATGIGGFFNRTLGSGVELNIPENGIENNLINFLDGGTLSAENPTWFNFDRLTFATGSSILDMAASSEQLDNIARIMQAYPGVTLKIGGYTDNTGSIDTNMKLSSARATTVMNSLVSIGIDATRMAAEGYGPAHPVASNDTAEGRAQNRRIAVRVTNK